MSLASLPSQSTPAADDTLAGLAHWLKGGGDPLRLAILQVLGLGSFGVLELCDILVQKQPAMSHHLKVLAQAGLVTARREGNAIFYRRALAQSRHQFAAPDDSAVPTAGIQDALFAALDALPLPLDIRNNVAEVRAARADACRAFFNRHAGDFRERQDLIAEYRQYAEGARDLLLSTALPADAVVLEVGPGHGEFLKELSLRSASVIALDISAELLGRAREFAAQENLDNVSFIAGDTQTARQQGLRVDAVACNMVLHHIPSPADTFLDAAALLKTGGVMLVTDLCRHEQDWVRAHCGDLWQGFEDAELDRWAAAAGLTASKSFYLGLRNGFQILFRSFVKPASP